MRPFSTVLRLPWGCRSLGDPPGSPPDPEAFSEVTAFPAQMQAATGFLQEEGTTLTVTVNRAQGAWDTQWAGPLRNTSVVSGLRRD